VIELLLDAENALALGLLDSAEATYRSVLAADPRNGIAAVGLSRVALERGDDAGALALAQAALEIDPDNATARRMVDRLEEVARFRATAPVAASPPAAPPPATAPVAALPPAAPTHPGAPIQPDDPSTPSAAAPATPPSPPTPPALPARPGLLRRILRRS
jgi:tetratricopeptide (TPR) repeat protein